MLDLTNNKKWVKQRQQQKKLYSSVFPGNVSFPSSRQGTWSRLSASSSTVGYHEPKITRLLSDPQLPGKTRLEIRHPRMTKSAITGTVRKSEKRSGSDGKPFKGYLSESHNAQTRQTQPSVREKSACSKTESEMSNFGLGVFLRLDIMEKGKIVVNYARTKFLVVFFHVIFPT